MSEISAQQPIYKAPTLEPRTREQLKKLQTKQMIAFFGLGAVAVASGLAARRAVLTRRYIPLLFDANNKPPSFNFVKDAALAVTHASVLAVSSFAFAVTGFAWVTEMSSIREFSIKMKNAFGATAKEEVYLNVPEDPEDLEVAKLEDSLGKVLSKN